MTTCDIAYILTTNPALDKLPHDFHPGYRVNTPNQMGFYFETSTLYPYGWYFYEVDNNGGCTLCGPFDDRAIVYACALKLHCSSALPQWRFSEKDKETYLYRHIHVNKM